MAFAVSTVISGNPSNAHSISVFATPGRRTVVVHQAPLSTTLVSVSFPRTSTATWRSPSASTRTLSVNPATVRVVSCHGSPSTSTHAVPSVNAARFPTCVETRSPQSS